MSEDWKADYQAPQGAIWICAACGRTNHNRADVGDESCFLNAVLVHDDKPALVPVRLHEWKAFEQ